MLGHLFHVQDAIKQKYYFKISYYAEENAVVTEDEVNECLEILFYGGPYEGKKTIYYQGFNIGATIQKSEIINALENMRGIHHIESIKQLGWHEDMEAIPVIEKWYHDNGQSNMEYNTILDYPDEDDPLWIAHGNNVIPHWKKNRCKYRW